MKRSRIQAARDWYERTNISSGITYIAAIIGMYIFLHWVFSK